MSQEQQKPQQQQPEEHQIEVQAETMHRQAPRAGGKNFGGLVRAGQPGGKTTPTRLGRIQNRQFFDSAEYVMKKDAQKKEDSEIQESDFIKVSGNK